MCCNSDGSQIGLLLVLEPCRCAVDHKFWIYTTNSGTTRLEERSVFICGNVFAFLTHQGLHKDSCEAQDIRLYKAGPGLTSFGCVLRISST
jgi:hypothetical protein